MSLNNTEKKALQNASFEGVEAVDAMTEILRAAHPDAFHTPDSLSARRFFDQPKHELPHSDFVRACVLEQEGQ
ncbi:hypothetical protein C5615_32875 [Burkholderia cepacia]|uniref:Uncharacterized protein n=1 Tax=Burkholderia cepacia TaxID=292 RepID=A0A2S8I7T8_BURCE|nr:hypothetical protein [Burkholderia cepacia]PQP10857.1 hypothetical protein C5615_32875 [Burkholderia cepacia]HDR9511077.1 hypothetical protein [Burkholderia cepacia]